MTTSRRALLGFALGLPMALRAAQIFRERRRRPMTLVEAARMDEGYLYWQSTIEELNRRSSLLEELPFVEIPGSALRYSMGTHLPIFDELLTPDA